MIFFFIVPLILLSLLIWVLTRFSIERKFKAQQSSIKEWLKYHGFGFYYYSNLSGFDRCCMVRLGSRKVDYKIYPSATIYRRLYKIRKKNMSREETIKKINEMLITMKLDADTNTDTAKDFWRD